MPKQDSQHLLEQGSGCSVMMFDRIEIDEASILRIQGYRDLDRVRRVIKRTASSVARETETLIRPCVYFRLIDVIRCEGKTLELEGGTVFENEAFQRFLKEVRKIVVFVLTMGHELDEAVINYIADDQLLNALFLETAGWLAVESATRRLSVHLRARAREEGFRLSPRLGPGYSYKLGSRSVIWSLEQQQTLFGLFSQDELDVELLESCAMLPKISRSGVFGFLSQ